MAEKAIQKRNYAYTNVHIKHSYLILSRML